MVHTAPNAGSAVRKRVAFVRSGNRIFRDDDFVYEEISRNAEVFAFYVTRKSENQSNAASF
jgi:hypothetical protein